MLDRTKNVVEQAAALDSSGRTTRAFVCDVGSVEEIDEAMRQLHADWGPVDVLVNNAGRTVFQSVWETTPQEWDDLLAVNLRSMLLFIQRCAPGMRDRGWGRIVNMSSIAGQQSGGVGAAHYAASKAGILALTKVWASELAGAGITVNAVAPGAVRTPVMDDIDPALLEQARTMIPVGRFGNPEEVAGLIGYLVSPEAGFITGATLDINGGAFMR